MSTDRLYPGSVRCRALTGLTALAIALALAGGGCSTSSKQPAGTEPESHPSAASDLSERWGIEVVALRLTGAGYMVDFRYRVLDEDKATELFARSNTPVLIHATTGARLEVPRPAKTGPLRPTNPPEAGRIYFILFANPGMVQAGDAVTVRIGEFEADLVVE
jgi:hypothetical protein